MSGPEQETYPTLRAFERARVLRAPSPLPFFLPVQLLVMGLLVEALRPVQDTCMRGLSDPSCLEFLARLYFEAGGIADPRTVTLRSMNEAVAAIRDPIRQREILERLYMNYYGGVAKEDFDEFAFGALDLLRLAIEGAARAHGISVADSESVN
ncbi:hypothetical protein VTK73DRAFT_3610 [Phialemonium thermophilum]|uniref:Uncharacterized protein n=1 Tax=Phialemonium thermophilum TaxID=223376 RepID=A0ABR3WXY6_9PEZI